MTEARFQGVTALVTGAASGIGMAVAHRLAAEGAAVVAVDRTQAVDVVVSRLADGPLHRAVVADLATQAGCQEAFATAAGAGDGNFGVLVNAAGVLFRSSVVDHSLETWRTTLDVNLKAPFRLTREFIKHHRNNKTSGSVVNVASYESFRSAPGHAAYTASKAALAAFTKAAAYEAGPLGVRVNAVAPGVIETGMNVDLRRDPAAAGAIQARHRLGRFGQPSEVALVIAFLASEEASFVTGAIVLVDGGLSTH